MGITTLLLTPDEYNIISGSSDKTAKIWDIRKKSSEGCVNTFSNHRDSINNMYLFPDGNKIISSDSEVIRLWDINTCKEEENYVIPISKYELDNSGRNSNSNSNINSKSILSFIVNTPNESAFFKKCG